MREKLKRLFNVLVYNCEDVSERYNNFQLICMLCGNPIAIHRDKADNTYTEESNIFIDTNSIDHDIYQTEASFTCKCGNKAVI